MAARRLPILLAAWAVNGLPDGSKVAALAPTDTKPSLASIRQRPLNHADDYGDAGDWSEEVVEAGFIYQATQPGDTVFEIGTNIGRSTIVAASCAGPSGRVITSEADPTVREIAQSNANEPPALSNIDFISAVSDTPLEIEVSHGSLGGSTSSQRRKVEHVTVATTPFVELRNMQPDVVIADCEGCFDHLLPGMLEVSNGAFLNRTRAIVLERDTPESPANVRLQNATWATLQQFGFRETVCVASPFPRPTDPLGANCFWTVLQRTASTRPTVYVRRDIPSEEWHAFARRAEHETASAVIPPDA